MAQCDPCGQPKSDGTDFSQDFVGTDYPTIEEEPKSVFTENSNSFSIMPNEPLQSVQLHDDAPKTPTNNIFEPSIVGEPKPGAALREFTLHRAMEAGVNQTSDFMRYAEKVHREYYRPNRIEVRRTMEVAVNKASDFMRYAERVHRKFYRANRIEQQGASPTGDDDDHDEE